MGNYRKTYLCICDGQQEEMYLKHVAKLIKDFPRKVVKFNTFVDSPHRLVKRYENYDSVAVFDFDFNDVAFERNIEICDKLNNKLKPSKGKKGRHIHHAYSNVNFDLWLIFHKKSYNRRVSKNDQYIPEVRKTFGLKSTANIKKAKVIEEILSQITLEDVKDAISRADKVKRRKNKYDGKKIGSSIVYPNPDFSIHEFLKVVLKDSGDF